MVLIGDDAVALKVLVVSNIDHRSRQARPTGEFGAPVAGMSISS
jgi:hypothetical protein